MTVGYVQPYAARKRYTCPWCETTIEPGTFHLVVIPDDEPENRRHWHHGCWHRELRRRRSGGVVSRPR